MPILSVAELTELEGSAKDCVSRLTDDVERALYEAQATCQKNGVGDQEAASAFVAALLVIAASSAYIKFHDLDKDVLALCFLRTATEAMFSLVSPPGGRTAH